MYQCSNPRSHGGKKIMKLPNSSSNLHLLSRDSSLEEALKYPLDEWRIFLHPAQQEAARWSPSENLVITGGPGTGKSIVLLHRSKWLVDQNLSPVIILTRNEYLVWWFQEQYKKMNTIDEPSNIVLFATTRALGHMCPITGLTLRKPISGKELQYSFALGELQIGRPVETRISKPVKHLLIDEGQDLSEDEIVFLEDIGNKSTTRLTVALDPLQAIESARGLAIRELFEGFSSINLTYSYRLSRSNGTLAAAYATRTRTMLADFLPQIRHRSGTKDELNSSANSLDYYIGNPSSIATFGFDGPPPRVKFVAKRNSKTVIAAIGPYLKKWQRLYPRNGIAIIWMGNTDTFFYKALLRASETRSLVKSIHEVKGLEFYAGVVLGFEEGFKTYVEANKRLGTLEGDDLKDKTMSILSLNRLYVALTRFRNEILLLGTDESDAILSLLKELVLNVSP
jgi:hypothetical protein